MGDEPAALRALQRGGDGDLHAELVRPMDFSLADAFDLGRMQAEDPEIGVLGQPPDRVEVAIAGMDPAGQHQLMRHRRLQFQ